MKNEAEVGIFIGVLLLLGMTILEFARLVALAANF
ncbi:hypothetical protein LCGC14_3084460 [marine sediment metagenome]|uniref:Uncharacterized protein n=1 Tax=marine sediment metagenome TaxID=412755 RepID=A0A0F8YJY7_9ZZZZ